MIRGARDLAPLFLDLILCSNPYLADKHFILITRSGWMSRSEAELFFSHLDNHSELREKLSDTPTIDAVIALAIDAGFKISEADIRNALNHMILNAYSLPRPWGWSLARKLGLVRT